MVECLTGDQPMASLVLAGPTGAGKTHLAAGIVWEVTRRLVAGYEAAVAAVGESGRHPRVPVLPEWLNVADAIVAVRLEFGRPSDDREITDRVMRLHRHPALVVLDDLGREKVSDWTGEIVYALVNARYEALLPTLVTTNLTSAELAESPYWPAISRLAEDGALVRIDAPDRRLAR
jgi:DNA replication protein DnaC